MVVVGDVLLDVAELTVLNTVEAALVEGIELLELDTVVIPAVVLLVCVAELCPAVGTQNRKAELRTTIARRMKI